MAEPSSQTGQEGTQGLPFFHRFLQDDGPRLIKTEAVSHPQF
jgi:hypothetical protein